MADVDTHEYRQDAEHPNGWCICGLPKANQRHAAQIHWIGQAALDDDPLKDHVKDRIRLVASLGEPFSANDVRPLLSEQFPEDRRKALIGPCFLKLKNAGEIAELGTTVSSTDPGTHGHKLPIYVAGPALQIPGAAA